MVIKGRAAKRDGGRGFSQPLEWNAEKRKRQTERERDRQTDKQTYRQR